MQFAQPRPVVAVCVERRLVGQRQHVVTPIRKIAGHRMTTEGVLIIKANRFRSQEQNRKDALNRLVLLIRRAMQKPKHRQPTKPSEASRQRRLTAKRHRGEIKRRRKKIGHSQQDN